MLELPTLPALGARKGPLRLGTGPPVGPFLVSWIDRPEVEASAVAQANSRRTATSPPYADPELACWRLRHLQLYVIQSHVMR